VAPTDDDEPETAGALAPLETGDRAGLNQLAETARGYAQAGIAVNTRRAYGADWRDFTSWCASVGASPLPAEAATIALYLTARASELAASSLARRLAAIRRAHRAADLPTPESEALRAVWSGIQRTHGRPPRKKRALVTDDLRRVVRKCPDTLAGARDRAVLLLGFAAALRRCELAAIVLPGVKNDPNLGQIRLVFVAGGLQIEIDRSKADQLGEGAVVGVPYGKTRLCPVSAVLAWLAAAKIQRGPVFRAIDRHGRLSDRAIGAASIAAIVKAAAERAGLDPSMFAGHSLRAGLATSAAGADVAADDIMRQTRHAKFDTLRGYIREADRFKRNAASKVGL
jgi:integrase